MQEEWRPVVGFEESYEVSNLGKVRSIDRDVNYINNGTPAVLHIKGKLLKLGKDADGYERVAMKCGNKTKLAGVHRLVAQAFILNPNNLPCVNHKDYNRSNNCVDNLEWCTVRYNNRYSNNESRRPHSIYENRDAVKRRLSHPVRCIETGEIFPSMIEAERRLHLGSTAVYFSIKNNKPTVQGYTFEKVNGV